MTFNRLLKYTFRFLFLQSLLTYITIYYFDNFLIPNKDLYQDVKGYTFRNQIDANLLEAAGINEWEKIHVLDVTNGSRLETYVVKAPAGSGQICVNGAAAHLVKPGNMVILVTYEGIASENISTHTPTIVHVNAKNEVVDISFEQEASSKYIEC